ncbi:MAG: ethanolamine ammonia-lyase reactivating factor EutA [Pirellulales bacterium]
MDKSVTLVGLDFGTTTSSAAIASAKLTCNTVTRRMELSYIEPRYYSDQVFTPFCGDQLDEARLTDYLDLWLKEVHPAEVFGGGAMITGLAAKAANTAAFARQIRRRLKDAVIAAVADPCLESWLAFMGNCWELSRANPDRDFVNLDIGGGTTNIALGRDGEVLRTGSFFVGARHIQFEPGGYRIIALSSYVRPLFDQLGIPKGVGDRLDETEVQRIVDWYLLTLESAVTRSFSGDADMITALHVQAPFDPGPSFDDCAVTLSGGVGQLVYRGLQSDTWPGTTEYGDLGIDMARRLVQRPFWRDHLTRWTPTGLGRATLFGLLRHNTQVSGSTVFLSDASLLPLSDLVIIGSVSPATPSNEVHRLVALAGRTARGACLRVDVGQFDRTAIRGLADQLRVAIERQTTIEHIPLVLLVRENLGKVLGQLVTNWGRSPARIVAIDEIDARESQFACIGKLHQGVLPVSFHGMNAFGARS